MKINKQRVKKIMKKNKVNKVMSAVLTSLHIDDTELREEVDLLKDKLRFNFNKCDVSEDGRSLVPNKYKREEVLTSFDDTDIFTFLLKLGLEEIDNDKYESDEELLDDYLSKTE